MKRKMFFAALVLGAGLAAQAQTPDAAALLERVDGNEIYSSIRYEGELVIDYQNRRFTKTMKSQARGNSDYFIEFTNRDDAGTKYLKKDGRLYVYSPDTEEVMLISGQMLKESMMGSDLSYEDTVGNETLSSRYTPAIAGEEAIGGRDCWLLELAAKSKTESYPKRRLWIDKETGDCVRYELFALSGAKLKEYTMLKAETFGGRRFPVEVEIRDLLRKNSKTTMRMRNVEIDVAIPDSVFSQRNLAR